MARSVTINLRVTPEMAQRIDTEREDRTRSAFVSRLVDQHFQTVDAAAQRGTK